MMIEIDGTFGEGGGQILRTSLALSALTGTPFRIRDIRKKRSKPGLMRQHLTCVRAAAEICDAQMRGAELRSTELEFEPGDVQPGEYSFSIGSAGSTTLVLQTVLPALAKADRASQIVVEGGTHNQMAPTFEFLRDTFAPMLRRVGPTLELEATSLGFYPAGGGRLRASIQPAPWGEVNVLERGALVRRSVVATLAHIPDHVGQREIETVLDRLSWTTDSASLRRADDLSPGPGNVVTIQVESEHVTETFVGFGEKGVRAESVAHRACEQAKRYLACGAPVGEHLADQLVLLLAAGEGGVFRTSAPTQHTLTQLEVIPKFLDVEITCERTEDRDWEVRVSR